MNELDHIRQIKDADIDEVSMLVRRCIDASCRESYSDRGRTYWASLYSREMFSKYTEGWKFWILSLDGRIVGCAGLNRNEIKGIFVAPELQGKKLGQRLLNFVEYYARSRGIKRLFLDSSLNAVDFYRRAGYVYLEDKKYETDLQSGMLGVVRMMKDM